MQVIDINIYNCAVYRNINVFKSFCVTLKHIYAISVDKIFQLEIDTGMIIYKNININFQNMLILNDIIYLIGKNSIYYFYDSLYEIGQCDFLNYNFSFNDLICSISATKLSIFSTNYKKIIKKIEIKNTNGLCSATEVTKKHVYFGFENGKVIKINSFDILLNEKEINFDKEKIFIDLEETIIDIKEKNNVVFFLTIKGNIVKYDIEEIKYTNLQQNIKKILLHENVLICSNKSKLFFLNDNLVCQKYYESDFDIINIHIAKNKLYIGYDNGLIANYDLDMILTAL